MSLQTLVSRTIIRGRRGGTGDSTYPGGTRLLVGLTLLINVALLSIRTGLLLSTIDAHRRYQTIGGSSLPGASVMAVILMRYGIPILLLIALGIMLWRDDGRGAAILYAIAAFVTIPFLFARYLGRQLANYPVSLSLHVVIALWLLACGLIAVVYLRRLRKCGRGSDVMVMIETTGGLHSGDGG